MPTNWRLILGAAAFELFVIVVNRHFKPKQEREFRRNLTRAEQRRFREKIPP